MEKMNLKDKTELEIMNGASLNAITAVADDWTALGGIADVLKESGNLDEVQFKTDETVTGEYRNMKLESPLFSAVDVAEDGKIRCHLWYPAKNRNGAGNRAASAAAGGDECKSGDSGWCNHGTCRNGRRRGVMVKFYVMKIKDGVIKIEDVPDLWKAKVEEALKEE